MKAYKVVYEPKVIKVLEKMDRPTSAMIYHWIDKNLVDCKNPRLYGKPLTGNLSGCWRYRIGDYRVLCTIDDEVIKVFVVSIGHRKDILLRKQTVANI